VLTRPGLSAVSTHDDESAIVLCGQRVKDTDVFGDVLSREADYCHLMIPQRFEPMIYPASAGERLQDHVPVLGLCERIQIGHEFRPRAGSAELPSPAGRQSVRKPATQLRKG
jgi:hypothetical protein